MRLRAIIFDLDGTLLDTLDDLADSMNSVLAQSRLPTHPTSAYRYFVGDGVEMLVRRSLPFEVADPTELRRFVDLMQREYAARWTCKTRPYPGVAEMLSAFAAAGPSIGGAVQQARRRRPRGRPDLPAGCAVRGGAGRDAHPAEKAAPCCRARNRRSHGHSTRALRLRGRQLNGHADRRVGGHASDRSPVGIPHGRRADLGRCLSAVASSRRPGAVLCRLNGTPGLRCLLHPLRHPPPFVIPRVPVCRFQVPSPFESRSRPATLAVKSRRVRAPRMKFRRALPPATTQEERMPALPHRRHPNEGAPDPFPAGTFEAPEAQPAAELGERPRGRLAKALLRALPGGLMLIDPQATVYVRSGRPPQVLALVLHEAHCHHEFLEAIGMGARPRQASLAASASRAEVMVVPKADGSMLCIGGSVPDLLPLSDWDPPPAPGAQRRVPRGAVPLCGPQLSQRLDLRVRFPVRRAAGGGERPIAVRVQPQPDRGHGDAAVVCAHPVHRALRAPERVDALRVSARAPRHTLAAGRHGPHEFHPLIMRAVTLASLRAFGLPAAPTV